jgi:hypothetical protein
MGANAVTTVPVYTAGEVLTAADMNITNSGIPVFATSVTRDAAFGGAGEKTLAEGQFAYLEDSNTTQYYDGAAWQSVGASPTYAIFNESQASGTDGGTATSGSYAKRVLNTTVVNTITGCSIASSVITLPAGTYIVQASAPAFRLNSHKTRLQNTTAATTLQIGSTAFVDSASSTTTRSDLQAYFTLATSSNLELQHRVESTKATNGFGAYSAFGDSEVYSQIYITKVA